MAIVIDRLQRGEYPVPVRTEREFTVADLTERFRPVLAAHALDTERNFKTVAVDHREPPVDPSKPGYRLLVRAGATNELRPSSLVEEIA